MKQELKVVGIQSTLHWHDPLANHRLFSEWLEKAPVADLYILPEMFSTGFSMEAAKIAEPMNGSTHAWMQKEAEKRNAVICGSMVIEENNRYVNRMMWVTPDKQTSWYDKRHCFTMAGEHHHFSPGDRRVIVNLKGWRILLQICYDLRFPVWSRNSGDYDAALYVSCWPAPRTTAWSKLLQARAIENQSYVVGVNRVGPDGQGLIYEGASAIIDAKGEVISSLENGEEGFVQAKLNAKELEMFRKKFPVLNDRDNFEIKV